MKEKSKELVEEIKKLWRSKKFDPNGSYTGNAEEDIKPLQDQDDL